MYKHACNVDNNIILYPSCIYVLCIHLLYIYIPTRRLYSHLVEHCPSRSSIKRCTQPGRDMINFGRSMRVYGMFQQVLSTQQLFEIRLFGLSKYTHLNIMRYGEGELLCALITIESLSDYQHLYRFSKNL
jgi:hypothetical protein